MVEAVLIFTFGPVQPFIAEARRTADLFAGSQILVELARAVGQVLARRGSLVYPSETDKDMPNKLVAVVPWEEVGCIADEARAALTSRWEEIARGSEGELEDLGPVPDGEWRAIWERQTIGYWETYWAAASLEGRTYADAYREADQVLAGVKRTRVFAPAQEPGLKDSLSGRRQALRTQELDAIEYWGRVSRRVTGAMLRRGGRERLDALGAVKRFWRGARKREFPSTSTVAAGDFLARARGELAPYRETVERLLGKQLYRPRPEDREWPYDGDLLYPETLTEKRLLDSYGLEHPEPVLLEEAREKLRCLYRRFGAASPYYGLLVLDGDDMGKRIDDCLNDQHPREAHRRLSDSLMAFSQYTAEIAVKHDASLIYNGGDDVMALASLLRILPFAQELAGVFESVVVSSPDPATASAGVVIAHHLYPLDAVVRAARSAEGKAKEINGKASLCVTVLKRSGLTATLRSPWSEFRQIFDDLVGLFRKDVSGAALASGFAYEAAAASEIFPEADEKFKAELKRLIGRHRNRKHPQPPDPQEWAERLCAWTWKLPGGTEELGRWLVLARFLAQGGGEV